MRKKITTINETVRMSLDITRDEYALCAYVQYRQADRRGKSGWCVDAKQEIADFVGITRPGLYKMIDRMSKKGLLYVDANGAVQVTEKWIDAETECKQSLQPSVNKVYSGVSTKFTPGVNLVTHIIEVKNEEKEKRGNAPAQILETLEEKTDIANNIGGPGWSEFPKAKTPGELANELRRFYAARPEEFRMTKDATPAQNWPAEKVTQVVNGFCDWAIAEGWERRTFQQINARLKRWFKDEQQYASKTPGPVSGYAAPPNLKTA